MIQILRMTAAAAAAVLVGAGLAGCSSTNKTSAVPSCLTPNEPVALAIGARSNSPMPALSAGVKAVMNSALDAHQAITIVRLDGKPGIVFSQAFNPQGNSQTQKVQRDAYVANVNKIFQGTGQTATDIRAQTPQADVLGALAVAASEVPRGGNVIVMDSGLQTTALLNFTAGLLNDDPQTIVNYLKSSGELPDMTGQHVYFVGLGWTAPPQPALDVRDRTRVVQIWEKLVTAAGASCVALDPSAPVLQNAVPNRPLVTIVTPPPPPPPPGRCSVTDLGDANNVGFDFDSTTFRDPAGARATLQKLADVMLRTGESVKLTGATSSEGSDQHNLALSLQRANAVRDALVQIGVPSSRITTAGVGSHLPGRLNDRGPNGQLLISPAIQNRKVVAKLTGAGCPS